MFLIKDPLFFANDSQDRVHLIIYFTTQVFEKYFKGTDNIGTVGYGMPIDEIDSVCRDFKSCYKCLKDVHQRGPKRFLPYNTGYSINLRSRDKFVCSRTLLGR